MASKQNPDSERTEIKGTEIERTEGEILIPEIETIEVGGKIFKIGLMSIKQSVRFTRLIAKLMNKGNTITQALNNIKDQAEREKMLAELDWFSVLDEQEICELLSIILSSDGDVDIRFIKQHWGLDWALEAMALWASVNPLQAYFKSAGKLMMALNNQSRKIEMNGKTDTP